LTGTLRLLVSCCALLAAACGAGDNRIDPSDLELRDLLGISPEAANSWDRDQRASARRVIEDGLHQAEASPIRAALRGDAALDRRLANALAAVDADRARRHAGALGLVRLAVGPGDVLATARVATIEAHAGAPTGASTELRLAGWEAEPTWRQLPARGQGVLSQIAIDAGHVTGPIVVAPAPRLAVVAGYLPATATDPARLVVNPVLLAALEPVAAPAPAPEVNAGNAGNAVVRTPSNGPAAPATPPNALAASAEGNPYSFYGSVAECAAAQRTRCEACLANNSCTAITNLGDGNAECPQLGAQGGRGYFLICINLALAIDAVATCTQGRAPSCPRDAHASESISSLENNASFLDDAACGGPLDTCLATIYGAPQGGFPGPGSGSGSGGPPPRNPSIDCGNSCSGDPNCDASPSCELDGPSCDDSTATDGGCADSNQQSGCDSGGDGGDGCSSDSGSGCDSGGGSGGDCSSDSSGDCGGGDSSGDCGGGGGGDCGGGGGGDCGGGGGGGGGDCNVTAGHGLRAGSALPIAVIWAFLPVPFAARVRRRAVRKRARAEADAQAPGAPS